MIDSSDRLLVFENFVVDRTLPKHLEKNEHLTWSITTNALGLVTSNEKESRVKRFFTSLSNFFKKLFGRKEMSVQQFFSSVKNSAKELEIIHERARGYEQAMKQARLAGQYALLEQLQLGMNAYKMESQLLAIGMSKYLEEKDVVRFCKLSQRGIRLDWVKNFTRQIPQDILSKKIRADEIGAFDNYAVLHYDPSSKAFQKTEEERKDPILFGLIEGRRRLYVVGDWVDEYCDLTLDQIAEVLWKDVVKDVGMIKP